MKISKILNFPTPYLDLIYIFFKFNSITAFPVRKMLLELTVRGCCLSLKVVLLFKTNKKEMLQMN